MEAMSERRLLGVLAGDSVSSDVEARASLLVLGVLLSPLPVLSSPEEIIPFLRLGVNLVGEFGKSTPPTDDLSSLLLVLGVLLSLPILSSSEDASSLLRLLVRANNGLTGVWGMKGSTRA